MVSETTAIEPGTPFTLGLRMKMDRHWHTYWVNPGDSGLATSINWTLPEGFTAGPIQWPAPKRIPTPPFMTYGFEDEILLLTRVIPPASLPAGTSVTIRAAADWLVCDDVCIPGNAGYTLNLPVVESGALPDPKWAPLFAEARRMRPVPAGEELSASYSREGDFYTLVVSLPDGAVVDPAAVYFFALEEMVVESARPQLATVAASTLALRIPRALGAEGEPDTLKGILNLGDGLPGVYAGRALELVAPRGSPVAQVAATGGSSMAIVLLLAFIGGLILNLMPCVFPVLGIKVLGFVNQAGAGRAKVTMHGLVFTAGVLASFWVLAGLLVILRAGGQELGWGFQLQSPVFVFLLTAFLLTFALNLSGVFEFGLSATGVGSSLLSKDGLAGSFFTGVLATIVATPCSAPFLAPALGAAVAMPPGESFTIFTFIALGLSAPYLVLSAFPGLVRLLPRPGPWMETFKQIMAFPLYATAAFLLWVLAGQMNETGFLKAMISLVLIAMAAWSYGRWTQGGASRRWRVFGYCFAAVLFTGGLALGYPARPGATDIVWRDWSPGEPERLQGEGRLVYVDFTARWCATCQSNKAIVFSSSSVREAFTRHDVVALKADWTNRNPDITQALALFGRSAVPFNLIYAPGLSEPLVLPELLTPEIVLGALDKAHTRSSVRSQ